MSTSQPARDWGEWIKFKMDQISQNTLILSKSTLLMVSVARSEMLTELSLSRRGLNLCNLSMSLCVLFFSVCAVILLITSFPPILITLYSFELILFIRPSLNLGLKWILSWKMRTRRRARPSYEVAFLFFYTVGDQCCVYIFISFIKLKIVCYFLIF